LFHVVPTLRRYAELTGDSSYLDEALFQTLGFFRHLQDPASGLLAHGYFDVPRDEVVPPFGNDELWARGNGWAIVAGVDLLAALPHSIAREELAARVLRLEDALRRHQDARTGLFHTLVRKPSTYLETAGSSLIVYGMVRGLRAGLFGDSTRAAATIGGEGLLGRLRRRGASTIVTGTSIGTNPVAGLYRFVPVRDQVTYGVGAFLLAASEIAGPASDAERPSCVR
jgi:unsaturated rhamnogalacturonyl hydrolase